MAKTITIKKFVAMDGTEFFSKEEAEAHEQGIIEAAGGYVLADDVIAAMGINGKNSTSIARRAVYTAILLQEAGTNVGE